MKMFVLKESYYNGTVTLDTVVSIIKAVSFNEAINKLKEKASSKSLSLEIEEDNESKFTYRIESEIPCFGRVENKEVFVIE